jgi:hypothetical protein
MVLSIFGNMDPEIPVMILLAAVIAVYLYVSERRSKKASDDLCKTYAVLTEEMLAGLSDEELLRAVAANLMNKQDRQHPDLSLTLPLLSPGRCGVYSVWLVCHEIRQSDLKGYFRSPYRRFSEFAAQGFALIGAQNCAAAMTDACERYQKQKNGEKELPPWDSFTARLRQAVEEEQPLSLCVRYIRDNPAEFTDPS